MRGIAAVLLTLMALVALVSPASAMSFHLATKGKARVVIATGEIDTGDARRLIAALARATTDSHGTKELLLNSPGGLVGEAFGMAQVIEQMNVTTIVPSGAICASACASVVFVAGTYRTVDKGGALIIHSCYDARTGQPMRDCDAVIAAHAQSRGINGGAMMAFQEIAGAKSAFLFDKAGAACYGLTRAPGTKVVKVAPCIAAAMKRAKNR